MSPPSAALDMLRFLEWSGSRQGPGSGPMFSGGDGREHPACPWCMGLKDTPEARSDFTAPAIGHRENCQLALLIQS